MQRRSFMLLTVLSLFETHSAQARSRPANAVLLTAGNYDHYRRVLLSFLDGLKHMGVIEYVPENLSANRADTLEVWRAMAEQGDQGLIRFLPDGHYSYDFLPQRRADVLASLLERIRDRGDVDLILVFGTEPSLDISRTVKDIPIMSLSCTDPVFTGVTKSEQDSGQDNLHVIVRKDFFRTQVRDFLAMRPFSSLGFLVADQRSDKSGSTEIRAACDEFGVALVVRTYSEDPTLDERGRFEVFFKALVKLLDEGVQAVMLPWFPCPDDQFTQVVGELVKRGIPSYSLAGPQFVSRGILLGVGEENLDIYGMFEADVCKRILEGESPRSISQIYLEQNQLLVNLRTAMQMGWRVPFGLLVSAQKVYITQSEDSL